MNNFDRQEPNICKALSPKELESLILRGYLANQAVLLEFRGNNSNKTNRSKLSNEIEAASNETVVKVNEFEHEFLLSNNLNTNLCDSEPMIEFNCLNENSSSVECECECECANVEELPRPSVLGVHDGRSTHERLRTDILNDRVDELIDLAITENKIMLNRTPIVGEIKHTEKFDHVDFINSKAIKNSELLGPEFYLPSVTVHKVINRKINKRQKLNKSDNGNRIYCGDIHTCSNVMKYFIYKKFCTFKLRLKVPSDKSNFSENVFYCKNIEYLKLGFVKIDTTWETNKNLKDLLNVMYFKFRLKLGLDLLKTGSIWMVDESTSGKPHQSQPPPRLIIG
ncbi:hypothetical protein KQX54_012727 [Cotesia glomerata]|uniref:Uncharacterized protein n=1 Tax=Cotesia glomerata TaxID=32391 RepID=A0AAV7IF61_COTGL|nr:hypothetical protein KQX54_012727 [Cotesia glomerata]